MFIKPDTLINNTFFSVTKLIANNYSTMVILDLGINFGNLQICGESTEPEDNKFGCRKLTIITSLKLILMPLIGTPIFIFFFYQGWIEDRILLFFFLFMIAAPNAINIIIVCGIKNTKVCLYYFIIIEKGNFINNGISVFCIDYYINNIDSLLLVSFIINYLYNY